MRALCLIDSITEITSAMAGAVIVSGSHGGRSVSVYALGIMPHPHAVFFNDAGIGKDRAGIVALDHLDSAGVICVTYSHDSARIGESGDGLAHGVVSALNRQARTAGIVPGQTVAQAVELLRSRRPSARID
ncbi:MAG: hypothetical protein Q8K23_13350 [Sulfuritalea sp.]|nr:hypothetical protein [Sulfuritalea sp.]